MACVLSPDAPHSQCCCLLCKHSKRPLELTHWFGAHEYIRHSLRYCLQLRVRSRELMHAKLIHAELTRAELMRAELMCAFLHLMQLVVFAAAYNPVCAL